MFILTNGRLAGQQVFWNGSGTGKCRDFRSILAISATVPFGGTFQFFVRSHSERCGTAVPRDAKRLNDEARRLVDATCSLSRSFRGVPLILLELRFARRRRRPRRTLRPVLLSLGHLGSLFGGQDVHDLRHHFRVSDFHFHLNLRSRFSR